jgi:class 3 adenylate cyclase
MFCSAEPAFKHHIRLQRALRAGEEARVEPRLPSGRYRLRLDSDKRYAYLDVGAAKGAAPLAWHASDPPAERAAAQACELRLVNDGDAAHTFVIETSHWVDTALRPRRLLSFQDFRDLYAEDYIGADVSLGIGEQTILFTDMVGSTALYAKNGDPAAFMLVKRHFAEVFAVVGRHRGAVVKTIGDAAMAAFVDPLDAVKAARALHAAFPPGADGARLRVSIHTGPCIAVKLDTGMDFFGHTVNLAAKLQKLCGAWQIVMSEATHAAPNVAAWLAGERAELEQTAYESAALPAPVPVRRWTVHESADHPFS